MLNVVLVLLLPTATAGEVQQTLACPSEAVEVAWAERRDGVIARYNELGAEFRIAHDVVVDVGPCDSRLVISYTSLADGLVGKQLSEQLPGLFSDLEQCKDCEAMLGTTSPVAATASAPEPTQGGTTVEVTTSCLQPDAKMVWNRLEKKLAPAFAEAGIEL